ncbi:MAG: type III pantothenate kinase [Bacteroidota bacterium]
MNLVVDVGNTRTKLAVINNSQVVKLWNIATAGVEDLDKIMSEYTIRRAIISSVRDHQQELATHLSKSVDSLWMDASLKLPFKNRYRSAATLGNDRKALVSAAVAEFPGQNTLIISIGTAITYDFINHQCEYLGGAISPGRHLRFKALHTFTDQLPLINRSDQKDFIGGDTNASIAAGVLHGIRGETDFFIRQYQEYAEGLMVILTGGDAKYFDKNLKNNIFARPNLSLVGLNEILEFND